jgi:uncharacterized protein YabN with tetrapyrrole methylase and pyrophosphatase domain
LRNWDAIKRAEKAERPESADDLRGDHKGSALDVIPRAFPALLEARKLGSRAAKKGFDWPDAGGLFEKLEEEAAELQQAIEEGSAARAEGVPGERTFGPAAASETVVSEVGDLLFTMVNLARHLRVDPEFALRHTNAKFRRRFAAMEAAASWRLEDLAPHELELLWTKAKQAESHEPRTEA